jgi:hypothetical protein
MRFYRLVSLGMAASFAAVGGLFILTPHATLLFFNSLPLGFPHTPLVGPGLWLGLAGAYMYLVTLLAFAMARWPDDRRLPWLLMHAKLASALLSLFFFAHTRYLILLLNFVIDFSLGVFVLWLRRRSHG